MYVGGKSRKLFGPDGWPVSSSEEGERYADSCIMDAGRARSKSEVAKGPKVSSIYEVIHRSDVRNETHRVGIRIVAESILSPRI